MSKGTRVTFDGLDALMKSFNDQPKKVQREVTNIVKTTALKVEKKAAYLAPYDTGYLEQEISTERVGQTTYEVTAHAEYSVYQEFGTRKTPPHPFMTPAVQQETVFFYQKLNNLAKKGLV